MRMWKLRKQCCVQVMMTLFLTMNLNECMDQMHFDALNIYNTSATWETGPATFTITDCINVSVVVRSTSACCNAVTLTNSSCGGCSNNNVKGCTVHAETFEYGFNGDTASSCSNVTDLALRCLVCQPGYCLATEPPVTGTRTVSPHLTGKSSVKVTQTYPATTVTQTIELTITNNLTSDRTAWITPGTSATPNPLSRNISGTTSTESNSYNSTNSSLNETSTEQPFDFEQSKKDLYTFLAALGASLLLVLIIVCAFFIRKSRSKLPVVNISEEFWSSKDYITDIDDEGNFCGPGASYSVINPIFNSKSYRDPSNYCNSVESLSPKYVKTETFRPSYKSYATQVNDAYRLEPLESVARTATPTEREPVCSTDDEAGVVMDLTKIVTNEIKSQQQRARNIEDRKIITETASSSGHYRKGKRNRDSRQHSRSGKRTAADTARKRGPDTGSDQQRADEMYAVSYKSRFHDYLDQCSAEESDV